ncbi:AsnC family transcriptional regulator [Nocardia sp. 2]|uniref:AsnC family transcriptional regulator n=1 Tax=Nocardia acididurans TaxID=2802282 RepID=A0ABS1M4V4_9NOCA|nr:AsnC family transcriptional regulator [Nocardia acididurans]MBL1074814.1 AsnC family transcriptional regulator [Nocardia acididurans]
MAAILPKETSVLEPLDKQIVRALQLDPRIPFRRIAADLGLAEQTIARRYRRLRRAGLVRVIGSVDAPALGENDWLVRVRCRPEGALPVAEALAKRDDAAWVSIAAGGAEVAFSLHPRTQQDRDDLLVQRLQRSAPVLDITPALILHRFVGRQAVDWRGRQRLEGSPGPAPHEIDLDGTDYTLLDLLARDGRTSYAVLARATGLTPGRVMRRVTALQEAGILYFDLDIAPAAAGTGLSAFIWLKVAPAHLDSVGRALADFPVTTYTAAVTGPFNLFATVFCDSTDDLYRFVSTTLSPLPGIHDFELSPVLRRMKQAGTRTHGDLLAPPAPVTRRASRAR